MTKLSDDKKTVKFDFGGELDAWQVKGICVGNAGNQAPDCQIEEGLTDEGWDKSEIDEFLNFINSDLLTKMDFS